MKKSTEKMRLFRLTSALIMLCTLFAACSRNSNEPLNANNNSTNAKSDSQQEKNITQNQPEKSITPNNSGTTGKEIKIDSITIKYIGNSCFYFQLSDGTKIITDPYGSEYDASFAPFPDIKADIESISHSHADHTACRRNTDEMKIIKLADLTNTSSFDIVNGETHIVMPECLNKTIRIGALEITGYPSKHIANMGDNTVFVFKAGNFKIVHMGETDKIDSPEALTAIKDADVLLAYFGNLGEIKNKDIYAFADKMNIKAVIPQHYSMDPNNLWYGEPSIDQIINELPKDANVIKLNELAVNKDLKKQFAVLSPMGK
ncbi:MAG: MBL fold metallo-hydrolase [Clostridiaceae bacterium]